MLGIIFFLWAGKCWLGTFPASIYLFKVKNTNIIKRCEICSKLTINIRERCQWNICWVTETKTKTVKSNIAWYYRPWNKRRISGNVRRKNNEIFLCLTVMSFFVVLVVLKKFFFFYFQKVVISLLEKSQPFA